MTENDLWHIADSRTGKRVSVAAYLSKAGAERQIKAWQERDLRGKRPDIHELMPYLVAVGNQEQESSQ